MVTIRAPRLVARATSPYAAAAPTDQDRVVGTEGIRCCWAKFDDAGELSGDQRRAQLRAVRIGDGAGGTCCVGELLSGEVPGAANGVERNWRDAGQMRANQYLKTGNVMSR